MPLLKQESVPTRDWVYGWYWPFGRPDYLRQYARGKNYKLYHTGECYEVTDDLYERSPIAVDSLDPRAMHAYRKLKGVLDYYAGMRTEP